MDKNISYDEMCTIENKGSMQKGMNFRANKDYSIILMSIKRNAPYKDKIINNGNIIEYEGHDVNNKDGINPKEIDQQKFSKSGKLTQNGKFIKAVKDYKLNISPIEKVKIYEKDKNNQWLLKGFYNLIDYKVENDNRRNVFIFILKNIDCVNEE